VRLSGYKDVGPLPPEFDPQIVEPIIITYLPGLFRYSTGSHKHLISSLFQSGINGVSTLKNIVRRSEHQRARNDDCRWSFSILQSGL
jgi:hypothetical protein